MKAKLNKRAVQKAATRELLIATAFKVFALNGILATKTEDITTHAGLSHGAIFVHFPTRDALLACVIDHFGLELGKKMVQLSSCKSLQAMLEAHLELLEEYEPFYSRLVVEGPLLHQDIRNKVFIIQSGIAQFLEKALLADIQKGAIRKVPLHLLLNSWLALIHYYLAHRDLFAPGKSVLHTKGKELLNYFLTSIKDTQNESKL